MSLTNKRVTLSLYTYPRGFISVKNTGVFFIILALMFLMTACSGTLEEEPKVKLFEEIEKNADIDGMSLRESKAIYAKDDDTSLVTMYLTVTKGNSLDSTDYTWADVNANPVTFYSDNGIPRYSVEGLLQVGDNTGPLAGEFGFDSTTPNSIVHIRGQTSTRSPQKSYKVEITEGNGMWRGQTNLALNKHVYDSIRFRNKLSYDLLKTIPEAFSTRTQFVQLYVKDLTTGNPAAGFVDHGLFTQAEQINKKYLRERGLDENGHLYKAIMLEFERYPDEIKLTTDPEFDIYKFETCLESRGNNDHSKIIKMLDDLNDYSLPIEDIFEEHFDSENYFTWFAFQILTGNIDTTSQNFFLYSPLNGKKWYFMAWDNDAAWRRGQDAAFLPSRGYDNTHGLANYWGSVLHKRLMSIEKYRQMLDDKINELRTVLTRERIEELVYKYDAIVRPHLFIMPDLDRRPRDLPDYLRILQMLPDEIEANYQLYLASLKKPLPFYISMPEYDRDDLVFSWYESYDFGGQNIKYSFELATDCWFTNPIVSKTDMEMPAIRHQRLSPGQYFVRVNSFNESGEAQSAMEMYRAPDDTKCFGVMSFIVEEDGAITVVVSE